METRDKDKTVATLVKDSERLRFLPKHLGRWMMKGENVIFSCMKKLSSDYNGGHWNFYELSNGGFFMAPSSDSQFNICVPGNQSESVVSPDAAGVIATLFALNQLMYIIPESSDDLENIVNFYYLLRDFAIEHQEKSKIMSAID